MKLLSINFYNYKIKLNFEMGNSIDSRAGFDGGYIFIKTDQPFYYPGNTVTGKIYIRADKVLDADYLEIKVKGKEKCSWWR